MKQVADNITIWTEDTYSKDTLYNIKYLWKDEGKENTDIQFMPRVVDSYRINTVDSPYKCVLKFGCGGWKRTILSYKGKNYIGGVNLLRFRLYTGKVNVIEAMRFLNNHLHKMDFPNDRYRNYIYPLIR